MKRGKHFEGRTGAELERGRPKVSGGEKERR